MQGIVRNRWLYLFFIAATGAFGLGARRFGSHLPAFIADYLPDALWALMVFWIIGFLANRLSTRKVMAAALGFSYAIEISQLYHAPWIDTIRHTTLGGLVLGFGFLWSDMACYTVGVLVGGTLDTGITRRGKAVIPRQEREFPKRG